MYYARGAPPHAGGMGRTPPGMAGQAPPPQGGAPSMHNMGGTRYGGGGHMGMGMNMGGQRLGGGGGGPMMGGGMPPSPVLRGVPGAPPSNSGGGGGGRRGAGGVPGSPPGGMPMPGSRMGVGPMGGMPRYGQSSSMVGQATIGNSAVGGVGSGGSNGGGGSAAGVGGGARIPFDASDFPSLTTGAGGAAGAFAGGSSMTGQQHHQPRYPPSSAGSSATSGGGMRASNVAPGADFTMSNDQFPALSAGGISGSRRTGSGGGGGGGSGGGGSAGGGSGSSALNGSSGAVGSSAMGRSLPVGSSTSTSTTATGYAHHARGVVPQAPPVPAQGVVGSSRAVGGATAGGRGAVGSASPGAVGAEQFGLLGLLNVIRMTDLDLNTLALGLDLTTLGLNLNSPEVLYATFASPWADKPTTKDPQYTLPQCYYMQPPALKTGHLSEFKLETLFYIFYAMPRDSLQAYAAQELYKRDWRYHKDHRLWFTRQAVENGGGASAKGGSGTSYIYFDINGWERRLFTGNVAGLATGFLSAAEIQVKM